MRKVLAFAVVATATLGIGFAGTTVKAQNQHRILIFQR